MIKDSMSAFKHGMVNFQWEKEKGIKHLDGPCHENVISFSAADIVAQLVAGNTEYAPSAIGFIYGPDSQSMPDTSGDRDQTWSKVVSDIQDLGGNIVISDLNKSHSLDVDGDPSIYLGNALTLNAMSDSNKTPELSSGGVTLSKPQAGDRFYQVVLLSKTYEPGSITPVYTPFARAKVSSTTGLTIVPGAELAVYWTIAFK